MRDYLNSNRPIKLRKDRVAAISRRPFVFAILFCVLSIGLLLLDQRGMLGPTRGLLQEAFSPVLQRMAAFGNGIGDFFTGIGDLRTLRTENEALKQQVSQLQAEVLKREQAQVENIALRQQLAIEQQRPWKLLGAEVTVRSPDAGRRVITIARGSRDGVQEGMAVIGQTGSNPAALVGTVESVGPATADVLLITDFGSQISARVLHEDQSFLGLVQGQWQRGSRLKLEQIERDATLDIGNTVVSAGLTRSSQFPLEMAAVPANIPIGTVDAITSNGLTRVAELRPYADPDQVRYVWLILNPEG